MDDWFDVMRPQVNLILDRRHVVTTVAYETDETDHIADLYGFITADQSRPSPLVYYCYVKQPYRRGGFARALFNAIGVDPSRPFRYVCKTAAAARLVAKIPMARWDPLAGRFPSQEKPDERTRTRKEDDSVRQGRDSGQGASVPTSSRRSW
jgi:hypothetical protein